MIDFRALGRNLGAAVGLSDAQGPTRVWDPPADVWMLTGGVAI